MQEVQRDCTLGVDMRPDLRLLVHFEHLLAGRLQLQEARRMAPLALSSEFVHCGKQGPGLQHFPTAVQRGSRLVLE